MNAYSVPAALCVASIAGLVLLLLGDGVWDTVGLGLLLLPLAATARSWRRSRHP